MIEICGLSFTNVQFDRYLEGLFDVIIARLSNIIGRKASFEYPEDVILVDPSKVKLSASFYTPIDETFHVIVQLSPVERAFSCKIDRYGIFYLEEKEPPDPYEILIKGPFTPEIYKVTSLEYRGSKWNLVLITEKRPLSLPGRFFLLGIGPIPFYLQGYFGVLPDKGLIGKLVLGIPVEFLLKLLNIER